MVHKENSDFVFDLREIDSLIDGHGIERGNPFMKVRLMRLKRNTERNVRKIHPGSSVQLLNLAHVVLTEKETQSIVDIFHPYTSIQTEFDSPEAEFFSGVIAQCKSLIYAEPKVTQEP